MSIQDILNERGSRYGNFKDHARITQALKESMQAFIRDQGDGSRSWDMLPEDMREALEMIMHKVGRILNGDPYYVDNWVDIAGYAQLIVNHLEKKRVDITV